MDLLIVTGNDWNHYSIFLHQYEILTKYISINRSWLVRFARISTCVYVLEDSLRQFLNHQHPMFHDNEYPSHSNSPLQHTSDAFFILPLAPSFFHRLLYHNESKSMQRSSWTLDRRNRWKIRMCRCHSDLWSLSHWQMRWCSVHEFVHRQTPCEEDQIVSNLTKTWCVDDVDCILFATIIHHFELVIGQFTCLCNRWVIQWESICLLVIDR